MDLGLYLRVIWRFRLVVLAGFLLASVLAISAYWKVSLDGGKPSVSHRQSETWKGLTTLTLTQAGFPWGRTILPYKTQDTVAGPQIVPSNFADPNRLAGLSLYYARIANSDAVRSMAARGHSGPGAWTAQPIVDPTYHYPQAFVEFAGLGTSPAKAVENANRGATAFKKFILQQQTSAGIPVGQRIDLVTVTKARGAILAAGRRKTTPIVTFLTIMLAAIGLAFILENLRPRVRLVSEEPQELQATAQRSGTGHRSA